MSRDIKGGTKVTGASAVSIDVAAPGAPVDVSQDSGSP